MFNDKELKLLRLRAFGVFSLQISDSRLFVNQIVGTMGLFKDIDIADYFKSLIVSKLAEVLGAETKTVTELPALYSEIGGKVKDKLKELFNGLGVTLRDYIITSISVPEDVQTIIDQRSGMTVIGNMDDFMKYKMAMSMEEAAKNPNNAVGQTLSAGLGMGMGFMMPQAIQQVMPNSTQSLDNSKSAVEKLKDLKNLLDLGIITTTEFDQKKAQLLTLI